MNVVTTPKYLEMQAWNLYLAGPREWSLGIAKKEGAPFDALYKREQTGEWIRLSDLSHTHAFRAFFARMVSERRVY